VKTSITDRAARLESQIASLPRADDVAAAVAGRLESIVSEGARKAEERADAVQHELSGIASNINEIWIRVRETAKGLEEVRGASREDSATMVALIEEMAQSEERSAARLAEAERRFVSAVRGIEHERDRIFIETLNEFLERLPRRERNRLGKRMRALNFGRRPWEELVEEAPQPLQPDAPVSSAEKEPEVEHPVPVLPEAKPKRTPPSKKKRAPTESRAKPKEIVREEPPEKPAKKEKVAPIRPATPLAARQPAAKARRRRTKKNTSPATETVEQPSETRPDSSTPINASQPSIEPDRPS
jgi:hypothetical protein